MKQLRADPRFFTVTIAGHSEGSLIGMVAAREASANAYVSLEGAGRKAQDILLEQVRPQLPPELLAQTERILASLSTGTIPDSVPPVLNALFRPSVMPYLISWFRYDPAVEIAKLTIPVLIVHGTTDVQVTMTDAKALAAASPKARFVTIDGMNHILKEARGDLQAQLPTYSDPALPVVPKLLDEIAAFVKGIGVVRFGAAPPRSSSDDRRAEARESWLGPDKFQHFFMSAFIESLFFSGLQAIGASRNTAFAGANATTAAFGIGKELHDKRTTGLFSFGDLTWDALGGGSAAALLLHTEH